MDMLDNLLVFFIFIGIFAALLICGGIISNLINRFYK